MKDLIAGAIVAIGLTVAVWGQSQPLYVHNPGKCDWCNKKIADTEVVENHKDQWGNPCWTSGTHTNSFGDLLRDYYKNAKKKPVPATTNSVTAQPKYNPRKK